MTQKVRSKNVSNNQKIMSLINEAISLYEPDFSLKDINIYLFERILYILGDLIIIEGLNNNNTRKRNIISRGITRYANYKLRNISLFYRALIKEVENWKKQPYLKFYIIFPLNIEYDWIKKKRHFKIDDEKIMFRSYAHIVRNYDFNNPQNRLRPTIKSKLHSFTFAVIEKYEKNSMLALNASAEKLNLLRALFNFSLKSGTITTSIGANRPLSNFGPPKFGFAFDDKKNFLHKGEIWVHDTHFRTFKPISNPPAKVDRIVALYDKYRKIKNSKLKDVLRQSLILYGNALDEIDYHYSFLRFWQVLEVIFSSPNDTFKIIKKRIKNLFIDKDKTPNIVDVIVNKRNDLVHDGNIANIEQRDIHRIKALVDSTIYFLMDNIKRFNNKKYMLYFFDNLSLPKKEIKMNIKILEYIDNKLRARVISL